MNIILLSGGSGKRLWPLSNDIRSKQFIKIFKTVDGYESMVQRVYRQIKEVDAEANVTIATSKTQVSSIHNQLGSAVGVCVEPCRRDTFPAIALATAYLHDVKGVGLDDAVVVCPVDPYVNNDYFAALKGLSDLAEQGNANLSLMGIEPTYPPAKSTATSFPRVPTPSARSRLSKRSLTPPRRKNISPGGRSGTAAFLLTSCAMYWTKPTS